MQSPFVFAAKHLKECIINSRLGIDLNLNVIVVIQHVLVICIV